MVPRFPYSMTTITPKSATTAAAAAVAVVPNTRRRSRPLPPLLPLAEYRHPRLCRVSGCKVQLELPEIGGGPVLYFFHQGLNDIVSWVFGAALSAVAHITLCDNFDAMSIYRGPLPLSLFLSLFRKGRGRGWYACFAAFSRNLQTACPGEVDRWPSVVANFSNLLRRICVKLLEICWCKLSASCFPGASLRLEVLRGGFGCSTGAYHTFEATIASKESA